MSLIREAYLQGFCEPMKGLFCASACICRPGLVMTMVRSQQAACTLLALWLAGFMEVVAATQVRFAACLLRCSLSHKPLSELSYMDGVVVFAICLTNKRLWQLFVVQQNSAPALNNPCRTCMIISPTPYTFDSHACVQGPSSQRWAEGSADSVRQFMELFSGNSRYAHFFPGMYLF